MGVKFEAAEATAMALSEAERVELADRLLASLSGDPGLDEAWSAEIKLRVSALEAGEMKYSPAQEVIARARKAIE